MPMPSSLFFLPLLLLLLCFNSLFTVFSAQPQSLRLELFRRRPPPHAATAARLDYLRELVRGDFLRRQMISHRITHSRHRRRRRASESSSRTRSLPALSESFAMPLSSGAYTGAGLYFVRLQLGTPAQKFLLAADTGSDLTWVKCLPPRRPGAGGVGRLFRPEASRTYKTIGCASKLCQDTLTFSLTTCPTPASPCEYYYSYSDGSAAEGEYAYESATIILPGRRRAKLRGLVVGCTSAYDGAEFNVTDGVLGLSYSTTSFAVRATEYFGGRFSYCLVDHLSPQNASSYLTFGPNPSISGRRPPAVPRTKATELVLDSRLDSFYTVRIKSISVDGERLAGIPDAVWDIASGGGTIFDSGTSATVLVDPAYQVVTAALSRRLAGVPRMNESDAPFEYCYKWGEGMAAVPPKLVFHLAGGTRFAPPAKSYIIDVAEGVKCIGITSAPWPGASTIGNIMQQEHIWEFDLKNRRLRFRASRCLSKH